MRDVTRRAALVLGLGALAVASPRPRSGRATPSEAEREVTRFTGGNTAEEGRVAIELPDIVEDGNTVPLAIAVESPMTFVDHVTDVLVVTDGNPNPRVATFRFTAMSGRAEVSTRIRLARSENVIVVARTSDGRFYTARKEVSVVVGGCGR